VEDFTQHEIRHTTVTLLMELGVDPSVIKQIVGHSDVLTQEAYKHVSLDFARRALDSLGTVLALPAAAADA
jgi:site-specific recombinase XerD